MTNIPQRRSSDSGDVKSELSAATDATLGLAKETSTLNGLIERFLEITDQKALIRQTAIITAVSVFVALTGFIILMNFCQTRDGACDILVPLSTNEAISETVDSLQEEVNVFGEYPPLGVESTELMIDDIPSFDINTSVSVPTFSDWCITSDDPVLIAGNFSWQSTSPRGTVIDMGQYVVQRQPGCTFTEFQSAIPDEAFEATTEILAANPDLEAVTWRIVGADRFGSVTKAWTSEPFNLYIGD